MQIQRKEESGVTRRRSCGSCWNMVQNAAMEARSGIVTQPGQYPSEYVDCCVKIVYRSVVHISHWNMNFIRSTYFSFPISLLFLWSWSRQSFSILEVEGCFSNNLCFTGLLQHQGTQTKSKSTKLPWISLKRLWSMKKDFVKSRTLNKQEIFQLPTLNKVLSLWSMIKKGLVSRGAIDNFGQHSIS